MNHTTAPGSLSRIYVDREHVKQAQGDSCPWIVENDDARYRCRVITRLDGANTVFDITAKPSLYLVTRKPVYMLDAETAPYAELGVVIGAKRTKLDQLREAIEFLDKCRKQLNVSIETGALRDAHEWVETAARQLVGVKRK